MIGALRGLRRGLDFIYLSPPHVTGFYLSDAAWALDFETWLGALKQLILPATTLALFKNAIKTAPGFEVIEEMQELMCVTTPALRTSMDHHWCLETVMNAAPKIDESV